MGNRLSLFTSSALFRGFDEAALATLPQRMGGYEQSCGIGEVLLQAGEITNRIGFLLEGSLYAHIPSPDGRQLLQAVISPGGMFGQVLAVGDREPSPVTVSAAKPGRVLWLPIAGLQNTNLSEAERGRLWHNLTAILSDEYFTLQRRLICLTRPTIREKLICYLAAEQKRQQSCDLQLPLGRAEWADYLGVERSALCRVLAQMKQQGLLDYRREDRRRILLSPNWQSRI